MFAAFNGSVFDKTGELKFDFSRSVYEAFNAQHKATVVFLNELPH